MRTIKSIPALPSLDISTMHLCDDVRIVVDHFAQSSGAPKGTVLAAVTAILLALRSHRITVSWAGFEGIPTMSFFLLSGYAMSPFLWFHTLCHYAREKAKKPQPKDPVAWKNREANVGFKRDAVIKTIQAGGKSTISMAELVDDHDEFEAGRILPLSKSEIATQFGLNFTPLVVEANEQAFTSLTGNPHRCPFGIMLFGFKIWDWHAAPCAFVVKVRTRDLAISLRGQGAHALWPTIVPECGGLISTPATTGKEAIEAWCRLLSQASSSWDQPTICLLPAEAGSTAASEFQSFVDRLHCCRVYPARYRFSDRLLLGFAAWHHLTYGKGETIGEESWSAALRFAKWAVVAHTDCANIVAGASAAPAHSADAVRMEDKLRDKPKATLREIQRAFPKREQGYWRNLYFLTKKRLFPEEAPRTWKI